MGCAVALVIGIGTVAIVVAVSHPSGTHRTELLEESPFLLFSVLLVAAPFGLLALRGVSDKVPWLVGLLLTILFWSGLVVAVCFSRGQRAAGIGAGALVLISPQIIGGAAAVAAHVRRS